MKTSMGILTSRFLATAASMLVAAAVQAEGGGRNVGAGVGVVPVYQGSSEYRTPSVPMLNYESGSFFVTRAPACRPWD